MKRIKEIEVYSNIVLYSILLLLVLLQKIFFVYTYFIIGGWQVLGMFIHIVNGWFMQKKGARKKYQWAILIIGLLFLPALAAPPLLMILLYIMLLISPLLAICYISICMNEVKELKSRKEFTLSN